MILLTQDIALYNSSAGGSSWSLFGLCASTVLQTLIYINMLIKIRFLIRHSADTASVALHAKGGWDRLNRQDLQGFCRSGTEG